LIVSFTPARPIPEAILWHEGMLLTPEHFDELGARAEELLQHLAASIPFHWGVSRLLFDETQLAQGKVVLLELEGVMPDGFYLRVGHGENTTPLLDLETLDPSLRQRPIFLYLAVLAPEQTSSSDRMLRYLEAEPAPAATADDTEEAPPIPRLRPRFQLFAAPETPSAKYISMPIARIAVRHESWALVEDYQPPVRKLPESAPILEQVARTLRRVRDLAVQVHARWRALSASERSAASSLQYQAMQAMVAELPVCEARLTAGDVQPFPLYLSLCALAGRAAMLAGESVPPVFSPYRHTDIAESFAQLDRYLQQVLNQEDVREYTGFPFQFEGDVFTLPFAPEWAGRRLVLALRSRRQTEASLRSWGESALIGARPLQEGMRTRRVLGAQRSFILAERGLAVDPDLVLFQLTAQDQFLVPNEPLDITAGPSAESSHAPLEITLYVHQGA
jgi:type VI secretion system protein ImpJ